MQPKSFTAVPCKGERKQAKKQKFSSEKYDKKDVKEKIALVSERGRPRISSFVPKEDSNCQRYTFRIIENNKCLLYVQSGSNQGCTFDG